MPAPAVYVIAVVGTVGIAIAFKEFIYPHLAPRIDRWKAEYQAARKRRAEAERSAVAEVVLTQRGVDKDSHQDQEGDDSGSDHSDLGLGKGSSGLRSAVHGNLKNGLLIRQRSGSTESTPGDVELDWITSTATETGSQQHDLRLRKNNGSLNKSSHDFELNKIRETHAFLDQSNQAIPYTPLSPMRTPTPTHVVYNSSSTHSPLDSPFSTKSASPLPGVARLSKLKTDVTNAGNAESFPSSPPGLANIAGPAVAPFLPVSVHGTMIPDSSATSLPPPDPLSSPSALGLSSLPSQLLSPTWSHPSPYQTPPHVHAIPSLSQSYPLDDVLDYEHGLELLSPPSPLSRTDSPFELTGLSPRSGMVERSPLSSTGSGVSREQFPAAPVDSTNSTRSTTYVSFSSPTLSASSRFPSENGYENDFSPSESSSTFSSPFVAPTRLGDIGSESLSPHDRARLSLSLAPLSSWSSPPFNVNHLRRERNTGRMSKVSDISAVTTRSHESDARAPTISSNDNISDDYADAQTLSSRNRTRSHSTRTVNESVATTSTSTETHPLESAARPSRITTSESDFDTCSEMSDIDFLNMSGEEYEASTSAPATASGSVVYTRTDGSRVLVMAGGIGGPGREDGNESDTSSWSLAGGSE